MSETGTPADAVPDQRRPEEVDAQAAAHEAGQAQEEEWPPREWRETTRCAGHRQALYISLGMVVIFAVLVLVNIWGSHQG